MSRIRREVRVIAVVFGAVLLLAVALAVLTTHQARAEVKVAGTAQGDGYLYLLDPASSAYVFTFTIPTAGSRIWDVASVPGASPKEVWFTEPGLDRVARLVYTTTHSYALSEYSLPAGSAPLNLDIAGSFVWVTLPGTNRLARIHRMTGAIAEFDIPTANSYPADLDVAADGNVWFTQMYGDNLGHLVVTSTVAYNVSEYRAPGMSGSRSYGVVVTGDAVYVARTAQDSVTRFTPSTGAWGPNFSFPQFNLPNKPCRLAVSVSGTVWATERGGNSVSRFLYQTTPIINAFPLTPAHSGPCSIDVDQTNRVWFSQQNAGQVGYYDPTARTYRYFPLPVSELWATGIAGDLDGKVWAAGYRPLRLYTPLVVQAGVSW